MTPLKRIPILLINVSVTERASTPRREQKRRLIENPRRQIKVVTLRREILNLSMKAIIVVSTTLIAELMPAKKRERKKSGPIIVPKGIGMVLRALGMVIKARPTPWVATLSIGTPFWYAIFPSMEKTIIADMRLKAQSRKPVIKALLTISDFLGR